MCVGVPLLHTYRPYEGMDITGTTGLLEAQQTTLEALGALGAISLQECFADALSP